MNSQPPPDDLGPKISPELAANIKRMVKQKIAAIDPKSVKPKGKTVVGKHSAIPCYFCGICDGLSKEKHPIGYEGLPKEKDCDECRSHLEQGMIAVRAPDGRYAFVYNTALAGELEQTSKDAVAAGKAATPLDRVVIGNQEFDLLVKRYQSVQQSN
jgi:hypothetical protein